MRRSNVATALVFFAAGLTASAVRRRLTGRRRPGFAVAASAVPVPVPDREAVVLPFARPALVAAAPQPPAAPARCGDSGGRTKAGAPCGARATSGGRCHHHPLAA